MTRSPARTRYLLPGIGWVLFLYLSGDKIPESVLMGLIFLGIVILGFPHGALDPLVAYRKGIWRSPAGLIGFLTGYLLLVLVGLALWTLSPGIALAAFLVYSAFHFASDWEEVLSPVLRYGAGFFVIGSPILFHPEKTVSYFLLLAGPEASTAVSLLLLTTVPLSSSCLILAAYRLRSSPERDSMGLLLLAVASFILPPLYFFTLFFCFHHSPHHLAEALKGISQRAALIWGGSITALAVVLMFILVPGLDSLHPSEAIIRWIFISLAVLTIPHVLIVERTGEESP